MPPDLTTMRHAQLFELLRQENLSEDTAERLKARRFARSEIDKDDAEKLCNVAVQSWG